MTRRFELHFGSTADLLREVESNLRRGRTFVPGQVAPADRSPCVVAVHHPESGAHVELGGEIVFSQAEGAVVGVGIDLVDPDLVQRIERLLVRGPSGEFALEPVEAVDPSDPVPTEPVDAAVLIDPEWTLPEEEDPELLAAGSLRPSQAPDSRRGITVHERVRKLAPAARDKLARTGQLAERVALERAFGASVWDALLENSQISGAEIAKIAKNGLAPASVLSHIAGHAGWLSRPEVRRALLSNSRLPVAQAERVLRALPQAELRLVPSQAGYPPAIRTLARRLLQR